MIVELSWIDLLISSLFITSMGVISFVYKLNLGSKIFWATLRSFIQLIFIGHVLTYLFRASSPLLIFSVLFFMLLIASREVVSRQHRPLPLKWSYPIGLFSLGLTSFVIGLIALKFIISPSPWYSPQYLIPIIGMLMGNAMTGITLSTDRLLQLTYDQRDIIEAKLSLGMTAAQAQAPLISESLRVGLIPILNTMAAAGIVHLPGMMTGQILGGADPTSAAKYQIMIMFLIAGTIGLGSFISVKLTTKKLFDHRDRLI